jgi:tRNA1(Val) A37 N6-methylase TrmN6
MRSGSRSAKQQLPEVDLAGLNPMHDYTEETYGERIADVYDQWYQGYDDLMLGTLSDLAHGGPVLELGIGTGRVALPLHQKGVHVQGIETSEAMLNQLRSNYTAGLTVPIAWGQR